MIHQLQVTYVREHDRILVRMNTRAGEEIRLWLTRNMLKNLFPHLIQAAAELVAPQPQTDSVSPVGPVGSAHPVDPASPADTFSGPAVAHDGANTQALAQFKKQEVLQKSDFSTPFATQAAKLPIGSEPLLATTVRVGHNEGGKLRIGFEEKLADAPQKRQFEIVLGSDLLHGFLHLLESALKHADWGISLGAIPAPEDSSPADAFSAAEPPRYLN